MPTLTLDQARQLEKMFSDAAIAVRDFKIDNYNKLKAADVTKLEKAQRSLLGQSSDMDSYAIQISFKNVKEAIAQLTKVTDDAKKAISTLKTISSVTGIVAGLVKLGFTVLSANPDSILASVEQLTQTIQKAVSGDDDKTGPKKGT